MCSYVAFGFCCQFVVFILCPGLFCSNKETPLMIYSGDEVTKLTASQRKRKRVVVDVNYELMSVLV